MLGESRGESGLTMPRMDACVVLDQCVVKQALSIQVV